AARDIIVSYNHYVATPSACGIWEGDRERDYRNMRSPNFGCATQNNLAAMIGDPHDLIEPAEMTPPDSATRIRGVTAFRKGEVTSSATDGEVETEVAN
ncbi:MAG: CpaD family pilus assembly lipoprotein, partial [Pseudomonadota bacterium]